MPWSDVIDRLKRFEHPKFGRCLRNVRADVVTTDRGLDVTLRPGYVLAESTADLCTQLQAHLEATGGVSGEVTFHWSPRVRPHQVQPGVKRHAQIKNVIAIASGKGGVGKSTVTANLAAALAGAGARVGILDADIYGPSQPIMMGVARAVAHTEGKKIFPIMRFGMQLMSMGCLVEQETPMIWRGPMVSGALQQLLNETQWDGLDYLLVDLPPGTGDIQLTMAQKIPVTAAVIVTTPQDVALCDARKAYAMLRKVNIAIAGVVENMAVFTCPHCGEDSPIFGEGGGARFAQQYDIPLLASLPLSARVQQDGDRGLPTVMSAPEGREALRFSRAASALSLALSRHPRDFSEQFPTIVVEQK